MKIFTIGFTKKNANQFFTLLNQPGLKRVVDIRLNNASQLAGFTKKDDISFFLKELRQIDYTHLPELAPTPEILANYKSGKGDWQNYEKEFIDLLSHRKVHAVLNKELFEGACLLCSEATPEHCHRRLVAEYLKLKWQDVIIQHL